MERLQNTVNTVQEFFDASTDQTSGGDEALSVGGSETEQSAISWTEIFSSSDDDLRSMGSSAAESRSPTVTTTSASSIASSEKAPWHSRIAAGAAAKATAKANVWLQTQFLSPEVPKVLLQILEQKLGTDEHWNEADNWRKNARDEVKHAAPEIGAKLNTVIEKFDSIHAELVAIFSKPNVAIHEAPTFGDPKVSVEVSRGSRRSTAGDLVRFIRATDVGLTSVVDSLRPDFENERGFSDLYKQVRNLTTRLPRLNFLPGQDVNEQMDWGQTKSLVESLQKLPVWLASFRSSYETMASLVAKRFDDVSQDSGLVDSDGSMNTVPLAEREGTLGGDSPVMVDSRKRESAS